MPCAPGPRHTNIITENGSKNGHSKIDKTNIFVTNGSLRYFSRNSPILQVFAHHIPDKLAVSFNSSSSLLSSYKWFLTIGSKYSFVKAYNVEI